MTLSFSSAGTWFSRHAPLIPAGARVLDLACGGGRHARFFAERGHPVTAIDRDLSGVDDLQGDDRFELIEADLEAAPWPLQGRDFAAVVVSNYLWRPRVPDLIALVAPAGLLLYQTFAVGQEALGRPQNRDFLLAPGELLSWLDESFTVVSYESGIEDELRVIQRVAAIRGAGPFALA